MARNDERFQIPFQVDPSWYERYWWHDPAPRRPGVFAFFRRLGIHAVAKAKEYLNWRQAHCREAMASVSGEPLLDRSGSEACP
jgi:hypothetical protein